MALLLISALISSSSGFGGVAVAPAPRRRRGRSSPPHHQLQNHHFDHSSSCRPSPYTSATSAPSPSSLSALIYGWDGDVEDTSNNDDQQFSYQGLDSDLDNSEQCTPTGIAYAEALSYDRDRAGHLARLAVAFSPRERSFSLEDILKIDVICVKQDSIDIEAILCEDGGCVSLNVPVKFPQNCGDDYLEGCVMHNIDELNTQAEGILTAMEQAQQNEPDYEELCMLANAKVELPHWWVPPECDATLARDCDGIKSLLNEEEFQPDIKALAQDTLRTSPNGEGYVVQTVRVAAVGPAGIAMKVIAEYQHDYNRPRHTLDVMYPFGGEPHTNVDSLRAAVLGAVAAAEGN